ncbi:MAG: endolytic transglycosylase MltG [Firmicutes bacterium]|nr:endolytic transglycosylase MltG [Bacillota bacterium]
MIFINVKDVFSQLNFKRGKGSGQSGRALGGVIIIGGGFLLLVFLGLLWNLTPAQPGVKNTQVFEIRRNASLRGVARDLSSRGLIRSSLAFEIYVRLDFKRRMPKAGWYQLSPGMSAARMVRELQRGTPREVRITIPEGLTIKEIANLLTQKGYVDPKKFLAVAGDSNLIRDNLGEELARDIAGLPEGYLFPDTYNFMLPVTEDHIIAAMLRRFRTVFQENFGNIPANKRRELVIMASLVEMEARKDEERPVIAGLFYNRLRIGMRLDSCATVQYVLGTHKHLYYKDLQVESPYNTYLHQGLPPGPIANPGLASLLAAANPEPVRFLYFVAKPDGSHIFSRTLTEHNRAKQEIERMR